MGCTDVGRIGAHNSAHIFMRFHDGEEVRATTTDTTWNARATTGKMDLYLRVLNGCIFFLACRFSRIIIFQSLMHEPGLASVFKIEILSEA